MSGLDFLLDGEVEPEPLRLALAGALSVDPERVLVIADLPEITPEALVIAQVGELDGEFPTSVALYTREDKGPGPLSTVAAVARALGRRALVGDGAPDPFSWLLVLPDGRVEAVAVDPEALEREEFRIVRDDAA